MRHNRPLLKKILSIILSLAVVLPAALTLVSGNGSARTLASTPAVVTLKQTVTGPISVLAIEPSSQHLLTAATVAGWTGLSESAITMTYLSALEFAGKNDDLLENYDLIYIGDNGGTAVTGLDTGYMYANIGASVPINNNAVGLTDAEYSSSTFSSGGKNYFALKSGPSSRYSGNDLPTAKLAALNSYVGAGHPVIVGSGLTGGGNEAFTFGARVTGVPSGTGALLTASVTLVSGTLPINVTPTYQWYSCTNKIYNNPTLLSGKTASTILATDANMNYYCTITYTVSGKSATATSNNVRFSLSGNAFTEITNDATTAQIGTFYKNYSFSVSSNGGMWSSNMWTGAWYTAPTGTPSNTNYRITLNKVYHNANTNATGSPSVVYQSTSTSSSVSLDSFDVSLPNNGDWAYYYWTIELLDGSGRSFSNVAVGSRYLDTRSGQSYSLATQSTGVTDGSYKTTGTFIPTITPTSGTVTWGQSLSAGYTESGDLSGTSRSFQWYRDGVALSGQTGYSMYIDCSSWSAGTSYSYYYIATLTYGSSSWTAKSNTVTMTRYASLVTVTDTGGNAPTGTLGGSSSGGLTISTAAVDSSSAMYAFLNTNIGRSNVMSSADVDTDTLSACLNLSKPIINLSTYPTTYSRNGSAVTGLAPDTSGTYTLQYSFTITNPTDATPADTRYYCYLSIDADSDGRYTTAERLDRITIRKAPESGETEGKLVSSGALKAGQQYIVTRTMPADRVGILPWQLQVVKVTNEDVHSAVRGLAYIPPNGQAETLNILQINTARSAGQITGSGSTTAYGGLPLDSTRPSITDSGINATRNTILDLIDAVSADYDINIQTITTTAANNISASPVTNTLAADSNGTYTAYSSISELLSSYDMVLLGFDDCYQELSKASAAAIAAYLTAGHPVLFSHDAISQSNVPQVYPTNSTSSNSQIAASSYYGYSFGTVMRSLLGLDRYGVTSTDYGLTAKSNAASSSGLVASGYTGLTDTLKGALRSAGYSIAYLPGSAGATPVNTTQGFSNYAFGGNLSTSAVTQLNKGVITSYPYDVNSSSFGGSLGSSLSILQTHQPVYQANLNSGALVVWYCLSGTGYTVSDASNAYYIFSSGNATYTGFGHTLQNVQADEAKLFVNTLIAAYRITNFLPEVHFTDERGENPISSFLVPADEDGVLVTEASTDPARRVYFTVEDDNIGSDKIIKALVSYSADQYPLILTIYDEQTDTAVSASALSSGLVYYLRLDDILTVLKSKGVSIGDDGLPLNLTVTTTIRDVDLMNTASITLRKLGLFTLS